MTQVLVICENFSQFHTVCRALEKSGNYKANTSELSRHQFKHEFGTVYCAHLAGVGVYNHYVQMLTELLANYPDDIRIIPFGTVVKNSGAKLPRGAYLVSEFNMIFADGKLERYRSLPASEFDLSIPCIRAMSPQFTGTTVQQVATECKSMFPDELSDVDVNDYSSSAILKFLSSGRATVYPSIKALLPLIDNTPNLSYLEKSTRFAAVQLTKYIPQVLQHQL